MTEASSATLARLAYVGRRSAPKRSRGDRSNTRRLSVAEVLAISLPTVNTYIRRIYEKLHARSRAQAVAKYAHIPPGENHRPSSTRGWEKTTELNQGNRQRNERQGNEIRKTIPLPFIPCLALNAAEADQ
jgi:hypothetical protein